MGTPKTDKRRRPLSAAHKAKIAAALKGHRVSQKTRQKIAAAMQGNQHGIGHKVSSEARKRIGEAKKGNRHSQGVKRSPEWCAKHAARMKGNTFKLGHKDGPATIARKRGAMLARHGRRVLPSPAPGVMGFAPDYRAERIIFFRP